METTSNLVWATPVHITKLAAALESYCSARPAIHQIRLCHAYGKDENGKAAAITKLPQELVNMTLEHIFMPQHMRQTKEYEWEQRQACFERRCVDNDHWSGEDDLSHRYMAIEHIRSSIEHSDSSGEGESDSGSDEEIKEETEDEDEEEGDEEEWDEEDEISDKQSSDEESPKKDSSKEAHSNFDSPAKDDPMEDNSDEDNSKVEASGEENGLREELRRLRREKRFDKHHMSDEEHLAKYGKTYDSITEDNIESQLDLFMEDHEDYRDVWFPEWPEWDELCEERRENWQEWTDIDSGFERINRVLHSDFGIGMQISRPQETVELDGYAYWDHVGTQAWIALPCRAPLDNADATIDPATHSMAQEEEVRFRRVMRILRLAPGVKFSHRRCLKKDQEPKKKLSEDKAKVKLARPLWISAKGKWPRLTNVMTTTGGDEHE